MADGQPMEVELVKDITLDITENLKVSQQQHGLRHNDYQRYRQYCARRLRRLRKSVKLTHGRGKFVQKKVSAEIVKDVRHLMIPLYHAERAWSYAMELKNLTHDHPRKRFHLHRKLKKAVEHGDLLLALCTKNGDARTTLEAEAYASWLRGNLLLENDDWTAALKELLKSKTVYDKLGKAGDADTLKLYQSRIDEIEPSIRFCKYSLQQETGKDNTTDILASVEDAPGFELLKSKLDSVMVQTRQEQAHTLKEVEWRGWSIPIKNDRTRMSILKARDLAKDTAKDMGEEKRMALYDKLLMAYGDALSQIRDDLIPILKGKSSKAKQQQEQLEGLHSYVKSFQLGHQLDRNRFLIKSAISRLDAPSHKRASKPGDLVHLYETLAGTLEELEEIAPEEQHADIAAEKTLAKAQRCLYIAESYAELSKWAEALALYDLSADRFAAAQSLCDKATNKELAQECKELANKVRGVKSLARAKSFMEMAMGDEKTAEKLSEMAIGGATGEAALNMDKYKTSTDGHLVSFPPSFQPIPCKPLSFDLVFNALEQPDIAHRVPEQRSGASGFWGLFKR